VIVKAKLNGSRRRAGRVELYDADRFFVTTGDAITPPEIEERQRQVERLTEAIFPKPKESATTSAHQNVEGVGVDDHELLERARRAKNGAKFQALYDAGDASGYASDSEADLALCDLLAFWAGPDPARIDQLFRGSARMREKWERADYRERTIDKALSGMTEFYPWPGAHAGVPDTSSQVELNGSASATPGPEKPAFELRVETAAEILALPDPPPEDMLLGPLLVRGQRTLLGAPKNAGKTTMLTRMAKAVHYGEPFLEWEGHKSKVLFIDAEQGLKSVKVKLRSAGVDGTLDYLRVPAGLALNSDPQHAEAVAGILARGYDLVVVDPLYKLHRGDSNEERGMVDLMRLFDEWRTEFHFALLMASHTRKDFAGRQLQMADIFGSSGVIWGAEIIIGLERLSPGYSRLHFFADRDGDLPLGEAWGLLFDQDDGYRRDPKDGEGKRSCKDKVRDLLTDQPGLTQHELEQFTGNGNRTVRDALKDLDAESMGATADGEKMWKLPDETLL
jgi:hypothetical protein